jgi:hypothetical protein
MERREEGAVLVSKVKRRTWGVSWFPHGGAISGVVAADSRSRTTSRLTQGGTVEDSQSGQLGRRAIWVRYCCGDETDYQNRMGWEREILRPKENCGEKFGLL